MRMSMRREANVGANTYMKNAETNANANSDADIMPLLS